MVDNTNPNTQFHPYIPADATPQTGQPVNTPATGLGAMLGKLGIDSSKIGALGNGSLGKVRGVAQNNGSLVLGGLAALAIGAGLMRRRSMNKAR
jgi:LPXTG-motif cell wall-anchored protein